MNTLCIFVDCFAISIIDIISVSLADIRDWNWEEDDERWLLGTNVETQKSGFFNTECVDKLTQEVLKRETRARRASAKERKLKDKKSSSKSDHRSSSTPKPVGRCVLQEDSW
jgi:hypothetical protein